MIEVYAWLTGPDGWAGIPLPPVACQQHCVLRATDRNFLNNG